jgi:hypothetical protein
MLTPEIIEAIPATDYPQITKLAAELHEATVGALEMLSPKDVEDQENLRRAVMLKLDEAMSQLSRQIADLEALKKDLRIRKGYASSDRDRIESHKIGLYVRRKSGMA